jgi:hypothetical protein
MIFGFEENFFLTAVSLPAQLAICGQEWCNGRPAALHGVGCWRREVPGDVEALIIVGRIGLETQLNRALGRSQMLGTIFAAKPRHFAVIPGRDTFKQLQRKHSAVKPRLSAPCACSHTIFLD